MAVSALNMTPYFAGYPFQGKHRRRSITNYLNYDYKTSQVSRWYRRKSARSSSWSRFRRVASKTRDHYPLTQSTPPTIFTSTYTSLPLLRHPFCLSGNHDQLFDLLIVITTCSSHNIPDFADFLARSLASLWDPFCLPSAICTRGWGCGWGWGWGWCCGGSAALILAQRLLFGVLCIT